EEAVGKARRREGEREQRAGRLLGCDGSAPLLDQVDEPVGGVKGELRLHTNVCSHSHRPDRKTGARVGPRRGFTRGRGGTAFDLVLVGYQRRTSEPEPRESSPSGRCGGSRPAAP